MVDKGKGKVEGAWLTDIDDTIIFSGETPGKGWVDWLCGVLETFKKHRIMWVPMSGVALVKLGPRILYRLPEHLLSCVRYYGGDGSELYYYDENRGKWCSDDSFRCRFSDAQALAVLGHSSFTAALEEEGEEPPVVEGRLLKARNVLEEKGFAPDFCILDMLKKELGEAGYNPEESQVYFRSGSVSWMMLGDISAEPYKTEKAQRVRLSLIHRAEEILAGNGALASLGPLGIHIPFHGARGIKFVLKGNDKERGTRDFMARMKLEARDLVFAGNELFAGGNDNMLRNVKGITLLSVGEKTDPGRDVVPVGIGPEANNKVLDFVCSRLEKGESWRDIILQIRDLQGGM